MSRWAAACASPAGAGLEARPAGRASDTVVIGVGNDDRGDDGIGLEVARRVAARAREGKLDPAVLVVTSSADPVSLMGAWEGAARVIVVDASASGAAPGTVTRLEVGSRPLPGILHRGSTHALGVAEAIELARRLGALPASIAVYAVEGRAFGYGRGLSGPARAGVAETVERVAREVGQPR